MRKLWLVARHEYANTVRRRAFLAATVGIPLLIIAITGLSIFLAISSEDARPVGIVDQAGVVTDPPRQAARRDSVDIVQFEDEPSARAALEAGTIQAFYLLPPDYRRSGQVEIFYWDKSPDEGVRRAVNAFLTAHLLVDLPDEIVQRITAGIDLTLRSGDGKREIDESSFINVLLPFVAGLLFVFATMTSVGYLLQAVTAEKENRTIEVMATSLTPFQLVGGKAVGLMAVAMTQLLIWVPVAALGVAVGSRFVTELGSVEVPWTFLLIIALYFVPAYALIAGMIIAIGGAVNEMSQGQQIAGMLNLMFFVPYFFFALVFSDPNSPLLVALTLFPTTSFITVTLRWGVTAIPAWQLILSWLLLVTTAGTSVWAASRVFRAGMLRYGQPLSLRGVVAAVRGERGG